MTQSSKQIFSAVRKAEAEGREAEANRLYDLYWEAVDRERAERQRLNRLDQEHMAKMAERRRQERN